MLSENKKNAKPTEFNKPAAAAQQNQLFKDENEGKRRGKSGDLCVKLRANILFSQTPNEGR